MVLRDDLSGGVGQGRGLEDFSLEQLLDTASRTLLFESGHVERHASERLQSATNYVVVSSAATMFLGPAPL